MRQKHPQSFYVTAPHYLHERRYSVAGSAIGACTQSQEEPHSPRLASLCCRGKRFIQFGSK
jgi:hypothetical protein